MHNVLVVDFSSYKESVAGILRENGYNVDVCESAYDAMSKLKADDYALVISEVDLPGDNAFELYNYIDTNYPYIPRIMITEKEMDSFFDCVFREGIGNILCKPLDEPGLINLAEKLITKKKIFGLKNYLKKVDAIKKIKITSSDMIQKSIDKILLQIEEWGFTIDKRIVLTLVLNEIIINAVYHSHGYTAEKEQRKQIKLKKGEWVDVSFAWDGDTYGISICDYKGGLSKMKILGSLHKAISQSQMILKAAETGEEISEKVTETGRGLDLLRKIARDYYFVIKKDVRTEVIILFDSRHPDNEDKGTSLKIIEDV